MIRILRITRFPNLLMIALSQVLVRYCLILPAYKTEFFITGIYPAHLSTLDFSLLVLSTLLIAAGGYIINDFFDVHTDEINKPGRNPVAGMTNPENARKAFLILSAIGVMTGFYVAFQINKPVMGFVPAFCALSLWLYSSYYKKRFLTGNLIVALLCSLSVLITGLFEPEFYRNFIYLTWYSIIAFLLTLVREIIKDMEDVDGDERSQCKTIPVLFGIQKTKIFAGVLIVLTMTYLFHILYTYFRTNNVIGFWYLAGMMMIPLLALLYLTISAIEKKDFYYASLFSKIIMTAGILSMIPFWYYFLT